MPPLPPSATCANGAGERLRGNVRVADDERGSVGAAGGAPRGFSTASDDDDDDDDDDDEDCCDDNCVDDGCDASAIGVGGATRGRSITCVEVDVAAAAAAGVGGATRGFSIGVGGATRGFSINNPVEPTRVGVGGARSLVVGVGDVDDVSSAEAAAAAARIAEPGDGVDGSGAGGSRSDCTRRKLS